MYYSVAQNMPWCVERLYVNWKIRGIVVVISHVNTLVEILSF